MAKLHIRNLRIDIQKEKLLSIEDLRIAGSGIYGLIGQKKCGKSLFMKWLANHSSIRKEDVNIVENIKYIRLPTSLVDVSELLQKTTAFENLRILCKNEDTISEDDIAWYLKLVEFDRNDRRLVESFTKAEKNRLAIAKALIDNPSILLLDEPFIDYSISDLSTIQQLLVRIKKMNIIVIIASRNEYIVKPLCHAVFRFSNGTLETIQ